MKIKAILYSEKIKVYDEVMEGLSVLDLAIIDLIPAHQVEDTYQIRSNKVLEALDTFESLISKKSHYFREKDAKNLKEVYEKYRRVYFTFSNSKKQDGSYNTEEFIKSKDIYAKEAEPLKEIISKEFRKMMGI